jgi:hypothetical protein
VSVRPRAADQQGGDKYSQKTRHEARHRGGLRA